MMPVYAVYFNPSDYPNKYVVRRFIEENFEPKPDPEALCVVDTLEEARQALPEGLTRLPRHPLDDAPIIETWL